MRKLIWCAIAILFLFVKHPAQADEGMWLLPLIQELNIEEMHKMGLQLTADQIYSINSSSLKDAVGALDYGSCTAELISPEGLLLTNHHCGFDEIQAHSSVDHDYLSDGFWAMTREEELPNPGKTISFVIRIENVTERVHAILTDNMSEEERTQKSAEIIEVIENEATEGTHYEATVESFFGGNDFYLVVMETFKDVRLVGAPPESIGKFGHDADNWVWPRHTGDFSLFRVYCGPDGKPAEYSPENVPLKSKHFFKISLNGVENGDFAMVLGFPGTTNRYMTSYEIMEIESIDNPNRIEIRGKKQELMLEDMLSDDVVRIQYASKYSTSSNYWKYSIGQNQGIRNLDLISRKQQLEKYFLEWIEQNPAKSEKYGESLDLIKKSVNKRKELHHARQYMLEALVGGVEFVNFAVTFFQLFVVMLESQDDTEAIKEVINEMRGDIDNFYKDYNPETDKKISIAMLELTSKNVDPQYQPDFFATINNKYKGNVSKYVDNVFKKSIFVNRAKLENYLKSPTTKDLQKDPAFQIGLSIYRKYFEIEDQYAIFQQDLDRGHRLLIAGLREMQENKTFYPDANSTLRLTYGVVSDYKAKDAVHYSYYTTLKGVMEKEDPDDHEFIVSESLKELYEKKDYGRYGMGDRMPVCFTTNNDITGGNSGSPVINARGELIGVAFDGNWEAMSSDLAFEPNLQKCINVDIRYVLFVVDKYAGATHLIEEMQIVE